MTGIPRVDWYGCYDGSWQSAPLVPEAFAHPAKIPFALAERIYRHMLAEGWVEAGDRVVDPFGGIGGCGFHAALYGLRWTGVELEGRFVDLGNGYVCSEAHPCPACKPAFDELARCRRAEEEAKALLDAGTDDDNERAARQAAYDQAKAKLDATTAEPCGQRQAGNIETWRARYAPHFPGYGSARLLQGDSRRLRQVIAEADGVVSSPPYAESLKPETDDQTARKQERIALAKSLHDGRAIETPSPGKAALGGGYGTTPGQLGSMPAGDHDAVVSSPPYSESLTYQRPGAGGEGDELMRAGYSVQEIAEMRKDGDPRVLETRRNMGYSRDNANLGNLPAGSHDAVVSSPPYAQARIDGHGDEGSSGLRAEDGSYLRGAAGWQQRKAMGGRYGDSGGNLANLPAGELADGVVSSPPYAETEITQRRNFVSPANPGGQDANIDTASRQDGYGSTPGNLGALRTGDFDATVSSPPYADGAQHTGGETRMTSGQGGPIKFVDYGSSPGQLADLPAGDFDAAVSSPPYEKRTVHGQAGVTLENFADPGRVGKTSAALTLDDYGASPANLGNNAGETFWSAARTILEETFALLKPGGYAAWITGDFVRDRKRVPFGEQWLALCEAVGFEPVLWAVAWKAETHGHQLDIFGEPVELKTSKVSFFRRLANRNNPDAAIENEDVIFVRKPLEAR